MRSHLHREIVFRSRAVVFAQLLVALGACWAYGQVVEPKEVKWPPLPPGRGEAMDYGPFLSFTVLRPAVEGQPAVKGSAPNGDPHGWRPVEMVGGHPQPARGDAGELLAVRGISVKLANDAAICFDADLLSYAGGWTGGFLDLSHTDIAQYKGDQPARARGTLQFSTVSPGWAKGGDFADPRQDRQGPLPAEIGRYRGLYRNGDKVVLAYRFAGADILDMPRIFPADKRGTVYFTRTIHVSRSDSPLSLNICEQQGVQRVNISQISSDPKKLKPLDASVVDATISSASLVYDDDSAITISIEGAPAGSTLEVVDKFRVQLNLPVLPAATTFKVEIMSRRHAPGPLPYNEMQALIAMGRTADKIEDVEALCHGGPKLWGDPIETKGLRGPDAGPYAVDTVGLPDDNPWKAWMRTTAVDFFRDGRAAVATFGGDVWIVSGLDDNLQHVHWKRFATGLHEPLGLKIVDDQIYVLGRDQITRLHDLNNDGEADYYENFCNAWVASPAPHGFNLDLQRDLAGNFYFGTCGNSAPLTLRMQQSLLKVSKYGDACEVFATGLRAPNGLGIGPRDEVVFSDNQGHWTPVCRINLAKKGGFYGFVGDPARSKFEPNLKVPAAYDPPICWIPMNVDNSTGGQLWAPGNWGPMSGQLLSTSYGMSALYEVLWEQVDGVPQGGIIRLPLKFDSGIMRARVNPKDGQVWVTGMKGWQTNAPRDGCLQRVRATGKAGHIPAALHVVKDAISIAFSDALDPKLAADQESYGIEQWNYRWTGSYGSPDLKVSNPKESGHDEVPIKSVKLSGDRKTVTLNVEGLQPVMQMEIQMHLAAADGTPIEWVLDGTINKVK